MEASMGAAEPTQLTEPDSQRPLPQHVKRAVAYLRDNMPESITLAALTSACGVSERTLLKQFQTFLGIAPLAYLRRLRLHAARNELTKPGNDNPIADVALSCGFSHLGRFAAEYRRLFGETPSATRQRAGSRANSAVTERNGDLRATAALEHEKPELLILPLRSETLQENTEARALTERLAATLASMRIASVRLASQSLAYSNTTPCPRNAGAHYCLLGRLTQRGERLRVIVRLVDIAADRHIWGDSFDGSADDPFELQDRVVDQVLCGVVAHLADAETERANRKGPDDLVVHELTMQALRLILDSNAASARKAAETLRRAVDLDPADATATALLAFSQLQLVGYYGTESQRAAFDAAVGLSQRAVLLDSSNPSALVARAAVGEWLHQPDEADSLLARALAIDPTATWVWERRGYGWLCEDPNRAIAGFQRALQLRRPGVSRTNCLHGIANAFLVAGRWEDAELWLRKALAECPDAVWMHRTISRLALRKGDLPGIRPSVACLRRAYPFLTVSFLADNYPVCEAGWLEAVARAGMPLS
jgi:AraC-like DNA-binding protein/TolB-like protein